MTTPVIVAIVQDGAVRAYHRNGNGLAQVAQIVANTDTEPSTLAAMLADLGDTFGWSTAGGGSDQLATAGTSLPPALPAVAPRPPVSAPGRGGRRTAGLVQAEVDRLVAAVMAHPEGMSTRALAGVLWPAERYGTPTAQRCGQRIYRAEDQGLVRVERPTSPGYALRVYPP